ncbi:MAG: G1 family endopeptidase [Sulfobacillus thermotolerans]|nr:G1 family endopeptidase [Sulfobacillus thermotolerans]
MRVRSWIMTAAMASFVAGAPTMVMGSSALPLITHAPRLKLSRPSHAIGNYGWSSSNWSGYAVTNGPYTQITGSWIVPTVTAGHGSTYSSAWIGIDGFNNSDLIQTGTEQDYTGGSAQYSAWWEILPAAETVINEPVAPGDQMDASIVNDGNGVWTITLKDVTEGWTFTTNQDYSGPGASAEWILEAPTIGGHVATLANYGETTFNPGTVNGGANPDFTTEDGGVMIQKNKQVSTPSVPDSDTDGFNVAYGPTAPSAPAS